jgi:hypothetical protein
MNVERPAFMDSPYFVGDPGNWHLKPGAPEAVVKEFERFMRQSDSLDAPEIDLEIEI